MTQILLYADTALLPSTPPFTPDYHCYQLLVQQSSMVGLYEQNCPANVQRTCTVQRSFNLLFDLLLSIFPTALAMSPLPPPPQAQPRIVPSASATPPTFLRILPSTPSSKLKSLPHHEASWLRLLFYRFIGSNAPVVLAQCVVQCSVMQQRNVPTNRAANKLLNQIK